jgi:hypothetical protein
MEVIKDHFYWVTIFFFIGLLPLDSISQPIIEWENLFGGTSHEITGGPIIATDDGGCLFISRTLSNDGDISINHGEWDLWICKLTKNGNIQWSRTLGSSGGGDSPKMVAQLNDGGFLIVCASDTNDFDFAGGEGGYWYFKFNAGGQIEWSEDYPAIPLSKSFQALEGGDFEMDFFTASNYGEFSDPVDSCKYWHVQFKEDGTISNMKKLCAPLMPDMYYFGSILPLKDGSFLYDYQSKTNSNNKGDNDICFIKYNNELLPQWEACFGGSKSESVIDKLEIPGKGFLILASTDSRDYDVGWHEKLKSLWLLQLDYNGNLIKSKAYNGRAKRLLLEDDSKSAVVLGYTFSNESCDNNGIVDYLIFKIDLQTYEVLWQDCFGGKGGEFAADMAITSDNGYILLGDSDSEISGDVQSENHALYYTDVWVVKLAPEDVRIEEECALFQIAPNPVSSESLTLEFQNPAVEASDIAVFDARGALVYRYPNQVIPVSKKVTVTLPPGMSAGMYLVQVSSCSGKRVFGKFVKVE